jgi:capsule polysaccharide modification protein KpsS
MEKRVLYGLQLFPEAAIDYWIEDLDLVRHEDMLVEIARQMTAAGYQIVVKDHPLQFGFRQTQLLDRLKAFANVVIVPYEVSGNALLARCGVNVTATGTLGLQAGLLGNVSITGEAYYVTDDDFVVLQDWRDLEGLAETVAGRARPASLHDRQARIIANLLQGSFDADFFSFKDFDPAQPNPAAAELGRRLGEQLRRLGPDGEDWHGRHMPAGAGRHAGSPLN